MDSIRWFFFKASRNLALKIKESALTGKRKASLAGPSGYGQMIVRRQQMRHQPFYMFRFGRHERLDPGIQKKKITFFTLSRPA
jgi:hypothetical protein